MVLEKNGDRYTTTQDIRLCGVTVVKGFSSDGASIPDCFRPLFIRDEYKYLIPAVLHDYMYANQMGFFKSNLCFYNAMKVYKVPKPTRISFYMAVTLFGHYAYFIKHGIIRKFK